MKSLNIAWILLFLVLSPQSHSELNHGLISNLDWVLRNSKGSNQCLNNSVSNPIVTQSISELCMNQVCGSSDKVTNAEELALSLIQDPTFQTQMKEKLGEALDGISLFVDESAKEKILTIEAYHDLKKRNDLTPTLEYQKLHDLTSITNAFKQTSFISGPNSQTPLLVNKEATLKKLSSLRKEQQNWVLDSIDHFIRSPIGSEIIIQSVLQPKDFFKTKYPELSYSDALKSDAQFLNKTTSNLLNGPSKSLIQRIAGVTKNLTDPVLNKALLGEDLTDAEVSQYFKVRETAWLLQDVLNPKENGGQTIFIEGSSKEPFPDFMERQKFDQKIDQYVLDLQDFKKVQDQREIAYQSCYTNYLFQMATLPSKSQIDKAEINTAWAKKKIKEILDPVLSGHTKKMLYPIIDDTFFSMPRDRETFHQYFMDNLKDEITDATNSSAEYRNLISKGQHKPLTLLNIHMNSDDFTIKSHFSSAKKFCDKFKIQYTSDNALTSLGRIQTSWVSVREIELGKSVMLHELGHIAYKNLDSDKASAESRQHFQKIQKCLAENHPDDSFSGNYVSEDWSDLIAAKGAGREKSNFACQLNTQIDDKYGNLILSDLNSNDEHSTDFFRSLYFYKIQNEKLPSACQQLIESNGNNWKFNSCF